MLCLNMAGCRRRTEEAPRTSNPSSAYSWPFHLESSAIFFVVVTVLAGVPGLCTAQGPQISSVTAVTSSNWTVILQGEWMVKFYAPWCPACQQIQSEWESFGKKSHALDVNVGKVDVTQEPGLSGRFFVTTLPTIFHAKDGVFRKYRGSRMVEDLQAFISEKKWEVVEPIAGWKSPSSIMMSGMAGLFHLSGWIRQIHNYFTGPLGIPAWGSYIIFTVATLLIGLVLGLILVLLADCFCPSKARHEVVRAEMNEENVEVSDEDSEMSLEEEKDLSDNESEENNGAKDSQEDSAVEDSETEGEIKLHHEQQPSKIESESALRQRKTEAAGDNGP